MTANMPPAPPTIGSSKTEGLTGVWVTCLHPDCRRSVALEWDRLGLPDDTPFLEIGARRRFVCSGCGSREVSVTPDWREYRAQGMGRSYP